MQAGFAAGYFQCPSGTGVLDPFGTDDRGGDPDADAASNFLEYYGVAFSGATPS